MSTWTHIAGAIRIDAFGDIKKLIQDRLGNTCNFHSTDKEWKDCNVPCGSEGSLQYKILEVGKPLAMYTVAIWGDLRDYEDIEEIKEWFDKVTVGSGLAIRNAVLIAQCNDKVEVFEYNG